LVLLSDFSFDTVFLFFVYVIIFFILCWTVWIFVETLGCIIFS
jgi:hypothetical protein